MIDLTDLKALLGGENSRLVSTAVMETQVIQIGLFEWLRETGNYPWRTCILLDFDCCGRSEADYVSSPQLTTNFLKIRMIGIIVQDSYSFQEQFPAVSDVYCFILAETIDQKVPLFLIQQSFEFFP
jgi:hypothetical protein